MQRSNKRSRIYFGIILVSFLIWGFFAFENMIYKNQCKEEFFGSWENLEIFSIIQLVFFLVGNILFHFLSRFFNKSLLFIIYECIIVVFIFIQIKLYISCI